MKAKQIVAIVCVLGLEAVALAGSRPNVVLLLSDDHNASALGCAGDPTVKTPNIDRLANAGVRFTRAFSPNPICTPARATLLTGQSSTTSGVTFFNKPIPTTAVTWPETLRKAGYVTFYTGKWHNDGGPARRGFVRGKAIFFGGMGEHEHLSVRDLGNPQTTRADKFSSTLFADAAVEFLDGYKEDAPFCLYVAFTAPHDPRTPPGQYATLYEPAKIPIPPNFRAEPPVELFTREIRDEKLLPFPRKEADIRREWALYYGMITHLDVQVGRILDAIERTGQSGNTLVIFAGDQGLALGAHGVVGKQTLYEEGIRTPLIVRDPRAVRGAETCDRLVELVDIYPTICEAVGIDVPGAVEGRSLLPLYRGEDCPVRGQVYGLYDDLQRCVRTERYKYILHLKSAVVELFDLRADPYELNNLAGKQELAPVEEDLRGRLDRWRASTQHAAEAPR